MKLVVLLALCALFVGASPAGALDCFKATSKIDELICVTPELKAADEAMGAAYFKLLKDTADPAFHEALIASQRRWLKVRSVGPDRFGQAEDDKTDDRAVLLQVTRQRLTVLQKAEPIHKMEQERKIMSKDSGGAFAGFKTDCVLQPPPYGNWSYECWGEAHRQNASRVCSSVSEWASGHMAEYWRVGTLNSGKLKLIATCATGNVSTDERCPDPEDSTAPSHWKTNSRDPVPPMSTSGLWKYDPDIDPNVINQQWMHDCLFAPVYPPPEASRPRSAPEK
jgi:uncharacterized protein YecT (DUF1311 family)